VKIILESCEHYLQILAGNE